jgi:hypothetical protein
MLVDLEPAVIPRSRKRILEFPRHKVGNNFQQVLFNPSNLEVHPRKSLNIQYMSFYPCGRQTWRSPEGYGRGHQRPLRYAYQGPQLKYENL